MRITCVREFQRSAASVSSLLQTDQDWECGSAFSDYGAWCTDIYDGYSIDAVSSTAVTANAGSPDGGTKGLSSITYTCSDAATNAATAVTRSTSVRDTTPPSWE